MKTHDSRRRAGRAVRRTAASAATALAFQLSGCASATAPTHFHTLLPPPATAAGAAAAAATLDWRLQPVKIPAQVDQPQWVLRVADGSLVVLEQERWIAPLADEIGAALDERLTKALGPPSAAPSDPSTSAGAPWRVGVDVRRFELVADREARLEADWSIRRGESSLNCHSAFVQQPAAAGYPALASAQQRSVARLADAIAAALGAMNKGQAGSC